MIVNVSSIRQKNNVFHFWSWSLENKLMSSGLARSLSGCSKVVAGEVSQWCFLWASCGKEAQAVLEEGGFSGMRVESGKPYHELVGLVLNSVGNERGECKQGLWLRLP